MRVTKQSKLFFCVFVFVCVNTTQNNNNTQNFIDFFCFLKSSLIFQVRVPFFKFRNIQKHTLSMHHVQQGLYAFSLLQRSAISFSNSYWLFEEEHIWHLIYVQYNNSTFSLQISLPHRIQPRYPCCNGPLPGYLK